MSPKRSISAASLAKMLGMHRNTLAAYMKCNGVVREFNKLSDHDLDLLVKVFKVKRPDSGIQYLVGFL
ncbi:hypothetical protein K439DRAFT_1327259 [Ramaria rubella]|nr:hypothetical protein K439DRAFT_1327259 [Ramaria rubella]